MDATFSEWLNLVVRWAHVFLGILWIGQTYFFTWLDGRLGEAEHAAGEGERGQIWMVHSGGFYIVEKQKGVQLLPQTLHWFRWEAALTWLSGFFLLVIVYYLGGALVDPDVRDGFVRWYNGFLGGSLRGVWDISANYNAFAVTLGILFLVAAWFIYDLLARSPLGRNEMLFAVSGYLLLVAVSYAFTQVFSGRAAYLHTGALMGTLMAANVWVRILPAQREMIAATRAGKQANLDLAARAKQRSKHNTFMVVPVVFTMISNHYSGLYGSRYNWVILAALILAGWVAATVIRRA